jgi:hypothetical protein
VQTARPLRGVPRHPGSCNTCVSLHGFLLECCYLLYLRQSIPYGMLHCCGTRLCDQGTWYTGVQPQANFVLTRG